MSATVAIRELQDEHREWQRRMPRGQDPAPQLLLGIVEEVGELAHAQLKELQGIRGTAEEHQAAAQDAIGDIFIFMTSYCNARGWDLEQIINETWAQVHARRWRELPGDGVSA